MKNENTKLLPVIPTASNLPSHHIRFDDATLDTSYVLLSVAAPPNDPEGRVGGRRATSPLSTYNPPLDDP